MDVAWKAYIEVRRVCIDVSGNLPLSVEVKAEMSTRVMDFLVPLSFEDALSTCRLAASTAEFKATNTPGSRSNGRPSAGLKCEESLNALSLHWQAIIEIILVAEGPSRTLVTLAGRIGGFGPIQGGHLKKRMLDLRDAIVAGAATVKPSSSQRFGESSLATEIESLASLKAKGDLTEEEFQRAKQRLLER
jgi:hypothetical protein